MAQTLSHTQVLNCGAQDAWECCKHSDKVLPDLLPEYFSSAEIMEGNGGPGTVRVLHFGPAIPQAEAAKERLDKGDEATRTLSYIVVEGDPRYTNFTADVHFEATSEKQTAATWTAKYDLVGKAGPPEHIKNISILMFKTFEKAILAKKTASHTEVLRALPDAVWKVVKDENAVLPKARPRIFESTSFVQGGGEPGSIGVCKMGTAIPNGGEVLERLDVLDSATKKVGYTVLYALPDAVWKAVKDENAVLPKARSQILEYISFVQGSGEPGSIRVCKMGTAIPNGGEVLERLDVLDSATKKVGYTVLKGDPRFEHVSAVLQFAPGPTEGTTTATWTATYVPVEANGTSENKFVVAVWMAFESAVKA